MSKLTGRKSKKDIFYPETGLPGKTDPPRKDGYIIGGDYMKKSTGEKITGESTGKIKVDDFLRMELGAARANVRAGGLPAILGV